MRLRVIHEIHARWDLPVRSVTAALRLMPRDHDGQTVVSWRIEPSIDGRLRSSDDPFGNLLHQFQADGPFEALTIRAEGLIETADHAGVIKGTREVAPPMVYLRDTQLTRPHDAVQHLAASALRGVSTSLDKAHALMRAISELVPGQGKPAGQTQVQSSQTQSSGADAGRSASTLAHMLCAAARLADMPARTVAGHAACETEFGSVSGVHVWSELHVDGFGWVAFDPFLRICPSDRHVRVAAGLDYADVEPARIVRSGSGAETQTRKALIEVLG